jgi:2-polyprenyl-3-methyl-5-hydroxy-6-metoxy-1,4-benzoquinol methylase
VSGSPSRYPLKADRHSSHSIILGWLADGRGRRLLDVGAGEGLLSRRLTERGWRVTAIEAEAEVAGRGASHCERMIVADLNRELPPLDGPFDVILYADVLEHLIDSLAVLRRLNRHLAGDGAVVVSIPNVAHLWIRLMLLLGRFDYDARGILDGTHVRFFTLRTARRLLTDAGLAIERFATTPAPLPEVVPPRWHGPWLAAPHALNAWAARRLPRLLAYQFVVMARPRIT